MNEKVVLEIARFYLLKIAYEYKKQLTSAQKIANSPRETWYEMADKVNELIKKQPSYQIIQEAFEQLVDTQCKKRSFLDGKKKDHSTLFSDHTNHSAQKALIAIVDSFEELSRTSAYTHKGAKEGMKKIPEIAAQAKTDFIGVMKYLQKADIKLTSEQHAMLDFARGNNNAASLQFSALGLRGDKLFFNFMSKMANLQADVNRLKTLNAKTPYTEINTIEKKQRNALLKQFIGYCKTEAMNSDCDPALYDLYTERSQQVFEIQVKAMILTVLQTIDDSDCGQRPQDTYQILIGEQPTIGYTDLNIDTDVIGLNQFYTVVSKFKRELTDIIEADKHYTCDDQREKQMARMLSVIKGEQRATPDKSLLSY